MKIYEDLGKIQKTPKAPKNQFNDFGKYKYRSCEDILEALKPIVPSGMSFIIRDEIVFVGTRHYVKATASFHSNGDKVECSAFAREPESKKGMDESQITGAASSYARKYALNGLLLIDDTKDADTTNVHDKATKSESPKEKPKTQTGKPMTDKQAEFIIKIGTGLKDPYSPLSRQEVVDLVRWKAEQLGVDPKSTEAANAFLPGRNETIKPWEKFGKVLDEWLDARQPADHEPIFDEQGNEVRL